MPQIHKRFRIKKEIDISSIPDLPHIVSLMMLQSSILASVRWYRSLVDQNNLTSGVDRLFSVVIGAGWASEAMRVLKDLKKRGLLNCDDIANLLARPQGDDNPDNTYPKEVWMKCVSPDDAFKRLHDIRGSVFAHFWNRKDMREPDAVAKAIVKGAAGEEFEPVFAEWVETNGKKSNLDSINTMAFFGIAQRVFGTDPARQRPIAKELGRATLSVGILLDALIAKWCERIHLEFEPYIEPSGL